VGIKLQAILTVPPFIATLVCAFGAAGYFLGNALGMPARFDMPLAIRAGGIGVLAAGFAMMGWIWKYRKPMDVLVSTYITIHKAVRRTPPQETAGRTEPLVLQGPQRHVRHPMYFAVVLIWLGWWLVLDYTFLLWMTFFFYLWFNLVVIPAEERELRALYGQQYEAYAKAVPRFFPAWKGRASR
jgi:protein-S-isoprenylcysteine O-methyltransferase Ste14